MFRDFSMIRLFVLAYKKSTDENNSEILGFKKSLTPMFMLALLEVRPMYVSEMVSIIENESDGVSQVSYPYDVVFRLTENDYMIPTKKEQRDGRRRQLYTISDKGRLYLQELKTLYENSMKSIDNLWKYIDDNKQDTQ